MNPAAWLVRTALRTPDAPAIFVGDRCVADYRAFARRAAGIGAGLAARHGIAPGDRVAVFMKNRADYLEILYAAWMIGAAVVPINAKLHPAEAAWIIADAGAAAIFVGPELAHDLAAHLPPDGAPLLVAGGAAHDALADHDPHPAPAHMAADDLAWLFYTSGTTGRPKGVMITTLNLMTMTMSYLADVDEVTARDAILYAAPMSHGAGLYNFMHVLRGARHAIPDSGGFDAEEVLALAPRLGRVAMFAAPTMVRRLVDAARAAGGRGEGLRTIVYGGGPMYVADIEDAVALMGPRFVQIYGQGECPMAATVLPRDLVADRAHPSWRARLASVGRAQSCVEVRVLAAPPDDADDAEAALVDAAPGETGEIAVAGPLVMRGYWNAPAATAKAITGGWLRTGDMGSLDADGFLTLRDRSKDVIISGGTNIYPREVEEALLTHPSVHECAVVGRADAEWGETVFAFVIPAPGHALDVAALDAHCLSLIARFKRPKEYRALDALPKNNYGKVLKTDLRARL